jgi:hypothetical protein
METDLVGKLAQLPDGQWVRIEQVYEDSYACVRRTAGEWRDRIAVCKVSSLILDASEYESAKLVEPCE